jgi:tRNA nucleotidyltransferase (CCA-adding enzyme)
VAYTVDAAFSQFHDAINLSGDHREKSNIRKDDVVASLEKTFTILDAFGTGSIPRYTALSKACDLDVIVVLHWEKHVKDKTPEQLLQSVRDALAKYKTNVRKNGQAVTLHYETWPNVDIVPVSRTTNDNGEVLYYSIG